MKTFLKGFAGVIVGLLLLAGSDTMFSTQGAINSFVKYIEVNVGLDGYTGVNTMVKFGYNLDVGTAATEQLVSWGGPHIQSGLDAETLSIVSTDVDDDDADTGARTIAIYCIDADGLEVHVEATLNGTTPVITTGQTCKFINRAYVISAGTSIRNEGTINITQSTSGIQLAQIPVSASITQQLMYYVPSNKRCYTKVLDIGIVKTAGGQLPKVQYKTLIYSGNLGVVYDARTSFMDATVTNYREVDHLRSQALQPNDIIYFEVTTTQNATQVTGDMDLMCSEI